MIKILTIQRPLQYIFIRRAPLYISAVLHLKPAKNKIHIKYDSNDDERSIISNRSSCPSLKLRHLKNVDFQCRRCIERNVSPPALFCCPVSRLPAEKGRMLGGASAKTRFKYLLSKQRMHSKIGYRMKSINYKIRIQSYA
jgi:hypothetical protein